MDSLRPHHRHRKQYANDTNNPSYEIAPAPNNGNFPEQTFSQPRQFVKRPIASQLVIGSCTTASVTRSDGQSYESDHGPKDGGRTTTAGSARHSTGIRARPYVASWNRGWTGGDVRNFAFCSSFRPGL